MPKVAELIAEIDRRIREIELRTIGSEDETQYALIVRRSELESLKKWINENTKGRR